MKICPACGKDCSDEVKFCMFCGNPFPAAADIQTPEETVQTYTEPKPYAEQQYGGSQQTYQQYGTNTQSQSSYNNYNQPYERNVGSQYGSSYQSSYTTGGTNGFAIAALIIGILSIIPIFYWWVPQILAIIFGAIGLSKAKKTGTGRGMSIAGLVLGIVAIVIVIIVIIVAVAFVSTGAGLLYGLSDLY